MKKLLVIALLLCTSSAFAKYEDALKLFQENKFQESLAICAEDLVMANDFIPDSPNYKIRYLAAHNHWKLGNIESASIHFRKCMAIDKTKVDPYIDLALMLMEKNKFKEAASVAEDGLKVKDEAMLYWILGRVALFRGDYSRAKVLFEKANSIEAELYVSYNDLGIALMKLGKFGDANVAFSVAHAINPESPEINANMAYSLYKIGKSNEALPYAKKALELLPGNDRIQNLINKIEGK